MRVSAIVLFVHGGNLAAWCWDEHFLDFFADKGFRAVAVSLRGHGASTLSQPLYWCSIADYVDDVRAIVDVLGVESVLIGHSMGCFLVQKYLEKHHAPAAVLMAPTTPPGVRRITVRMVRRHPWIVFAPIPSAAPPISSIPRPWPVNTCSARIPPNPSSSPARPVWSPRARMPD